MMVLAVSLDLLITVPIVYFLLTRKSNISSFTVVPVVIVGLLIGSYILPAEQQDYLILFRNYVLPVLELVVFSLVVSKLRKAVLRYRKIHNRDLDFFTALKIASAEILPKRLVYPFATEIAVFYYGFLKWKRDELKMNEFSYHKKSGTGMVLAVFVFLIAAEGFAVHVLVASWNVTVAWIVTALSVYTIFQIYGFARSLSFRPIVLSSDVLHLRYGILSEVDIRYGDIDQIEFSRKRLPDSEYSRKLSPFSDMESHNLIIRLKEVRS